LRTVSLDTVKKTSVRRIDVDLTNILPEMGYTTALLHTKAFNG